MRAPRVSLVNPKATYADEIPQKCFPPLGLLYLAASLEVAGATVQVIDANALRLNDKDCLARLRGFGPDLVGLPLYAETLFAGAGMLRAIRQALPRAKLVVGGPQASASPSWLLEQVPVVDYVLAGEAEETLPFLARAVAEGRAPNDGEIPGLWTSSNSAGPSANAGADASSSLDRLPLPARHAVSEVYEKGLYYALLVPDRRIDCILTSRGCPHRCHFCYNASSRIRFRSVEHCIEELDQLHARGVRTVEILDDNFTASEDRAMDLLDGIRRARFDMALRIKARADSVTERLMAAARRAGVYQVSLGAESGSPALLHAMNKGITPIQLERAVRRILDEGINCHTSWIIGYPGETAQTLSETAKLVTRMKPTTAGFTILTPYPGTYVYEQAKQDGTLQGDWSTTTPSIPWIRLPWTQSRSDLVAAKRSMQRHLYFRPHYLREFSKRIILGANWTLARHAAQELRRAIGLH